METLKDQISAKFEAMKQKRDDREGVRAGSGAYYQRVMDSLNDQYQRITKRGV